MADARFTTKELEILCYAGEVKSDNEDAFLYQIEQIRNLKQRYEQGYKDVIADQHEAQKHREELIRLLKIRNVLATQKELEQLQKESDNYKKSYSLFRTANYHSFWSKFHLVRFVTLGLFLLLISISSLPLNLGGLIPGLSSQLTIYDFSAHIILGTASTFYLFEILADTALMLKAAFTRKDGTFQNAFFNAYHKGGRPARMHNAIAWFLANAAGYLLTGGWWDSTSFSAGWALPTWNNTIYAHWLAAATCLIAAVDDYSYARRNSNKKYADRAALITLPDENQMKYDEKAWYKAHLPHLESELATIQKNNNKSITVSRNFLLSLSLFFTFAKLPWGEFAGWAATSGYMAAPLIPWIAATVGIAGSALFLRTAWGLFYDSILKKSADDKKHEAPPTSNRSPNPHKSFIASDVELKADSKPASNGHKLETPSSPSRTLTSPVTPVSSSLYHHPKQSVENYTDEHDDAAESSRKRWCTIL